MPTPKLSIVSGTRGRPDGYARLIRSIRETVGDIPYEIVIGCANDDVDPDHSYAQPSHDIIVCYQRPRMGMIRGYNNSFSRCSGEFVVWLNDDVECLPGWAHASIKYMEENPKVGIGAIYFLDRLVKHPDDRPGTVIAAQTPIDRSTTGWATQFCLQTLYGLPYANFGILRRSLGEEIGWFPTDIGNMLGCDNAISWTILEKGLGVGAITDARVVHHRTRDGIRAENSQSRFEDRDRFDAVWHQSRRERCQEINASLGLPFPKTLND